MCPAGQGVGTVASNRSIRIPKSRFSPEPELECCVRTPDKVRLGSTDPALGDTESLPYKITAERYIQYSLSKNNANGSALPWQRREYK